MSALGDPFTRWRDRITGELLVAIAAKDDGEGVMVLPIQAGRDAHPCDWLPERVFLQAYRESVKRG